MHRSATLQRTLAAALLAVVTAGGGAAFGTSSAVAATPSAVTAADYYDDCDQTSPGEEPNSLIGAGCSQRPGHRTDTGVYIEDWGSPNDWICDSVEDQGSMILGSGCREAEKGSGA